MKGRCLVCTLSGQCGGASFREERLNIAEPGKMDILKINGDDDYHETISGLKKTKHS